MRTRCLAESGSVLTARISRIAKMLAGGSRGQLATLANNLQQSQTTVTPSKTQTWSLSGVSPTELLAFFQPLKVNSPAGRCRLTQFRESSSHHSALFISTRAALNGLDSDETSWEFGDVDAFLA